MLRIKSLWFPSISDLNSDNSNFVKLFGNQLNFVRDDPGTVVPHDHRPVYRRQTAK